MDVTTVAVLTAVVALAYLWTNAPLYNPRGTIDPWLYTALWTNFEQTYALFPGTYYVSRVPWIVPGYALNVLFDERTAFLLLHATLFLSGGLLFYVLVRRYLGAVAAAAGYLALVGSQTYFAAHRWDYLDGAVLALLIATYAFALPRTTSWWLRIASLALAGFCAAALVTTRIVDGVYLIGLPLLYFAVLEGMTWRFRLERFARDLVAFAAGSVLLLAAAGTFAHRHGAEFLFFMPQIRFARSNTGEASQLPVEQWLPGSPYFWVPIFVIGFALAALMFGPNCRPGVRRLVIATTAWLAIDFAGLALWEFLGTGWIFEYTYYSNSFLVPTLLCLSAAIAVLVGVRPLTLRSAVLICVCAAAVLLPVAWIYRSDSLTRVATGYGSTPYVLSMVAMAVALQLVLLVRVPRLRAAGAVASVTALFAVSHSADSSSAMWISVSDPRTGDLYEVGQRLIRYLRANGYDATLPRFWYDESADLGVHRSLQSLYYYGHTYVGVGMPTIDGDFRTRMEVFRPDKLVLLCERLDCKGAAIQLQHASYAPALQSQALLESGDVRVWVKIYKVALSQ